MYSAQRLEIIGSRLPLPKSLKTKRYYEAMQDIGCTGNTSESDINSDFENNDSSIVFKENTYGESIIFSHNALTVLNDSNSESESDTESECERSDVDMKEEQSINDHYKNIQKNFFRDREENSPFIINKL